MKIAVCINHVPDTATKIKINQDKKSIEQSGIVYIINPYDEFAIEEALKTKEKFGGEVFILSAGNDSNKESIRKALAMGADEGTLLKTDLQFDSIGAAKILAEEIKNLGCEIVFAGRQSVDFDNSIVGQLIAEMLNYNCVSYVLSLAIDGNKVIAEREIEGGKEVVHTELPVVITAQKGLNEPRYASLKGIMAAKKKSIVEKQVNADSLTFELLEITLPPAKNPGRILGSDSSAVPELVRLLKEEAKVI